MFVFRTAVVGAGTMGGQIAQTIAAAGLPVVLKDIDDALVQAGLQEARNVTSGQVAKLVERGKLTAEQGEGRIAEVLGRISGTTSYAPFGDVDFVIEAVPERMEIKQAVFAELDAVTPGHAILASNTSSLSIAEIGEATLRPDKVVGFHYFYPASLMPLIEIVESEDTSAETVTAAVTFAQAIRKQPITCAEVPGFVVNRILNSGISEVWRAQEEQGLSIKAIDEGVGAAGVVPVGPYHLVNLLGLDTVLHVAEHLAESYGDERFYVPAGMQKLVSERRLGAKTGGDGFYDLQGEPNVPGEAEPDVEQLVELLSLKTFIEACLVLEEGVATHRDIDFGMMAGAGLDPRRGLMPPFMKADSEGLEEVLERMENARERHGERFAPPTILRRLVAQGRLGQRSGQGFYAYPRPDSDQPAQGVKLETLGADARARVGGAGDDAGEAGAGGVAIAWLANGQLNSISPQVVEDLASVWARVKESNTRPPVRALVIASSNPFLFSAGADIKAFTTMDESGGRELLARMHALLREMGTSGVATIAAVNGLAFGGGCELAMACDMRIAARSALFGQPEIKLGIIPGFGGTQRLPRLVGESKALEMNLIGDPILAEEAFELGLVNRVVEDHELFDTALAWARRLATAAPLAMEQIKRVSGAGDLDAGIVAEQEGFASVLSSDDAREGISAFLTKRTPRFAGH
ncbi:MAG TPA: 3-hydroxyacyl-CoA dehydrogenase NAD-binding domain-containing protein [Solirubrobacteraceae bacterium]|jgi:enoyl-CoA hydratase/3-hydroxyacyl-CoA dehydrogenase|nr:3-hydroxyacyl-CoA dehydrogenase NAD-binding domain-containing protein [Solirubrobacteraceae bacterium]